MFATTPALVEPTAVRELRGIIEADCPSTAAYPQHSVVADKRTPQHVLVHNIPDSCQPTPEVAASIYASCPNTHYLYCTLMDGPVRGGNAPGATIELQHVQKTVAAAVTEEKINTALAWRRAFLEYERPGEPLPDQLKFKCLGRRGGDNHGFTSDEMKKAVAGGLAAAGMVGSVVSPRCTVLAHLHFGQLHIGLRLNTFDCTLGIPQLNLSPDASATAPRIVAVKRQPVQQSATDLQDEEEEEAPVEAAQAESDAATALDAVAPWAGRQYDSQLKEKHQLCLKSTVKFVRKLKKTWLSAIGKGRIKKKPTGGKLTQVREGDWVCASCGSNVFATKSECFKCGAPRDGAAPAAERTTAPMPQWLHKPEVVDKSVKRQIFQFGTSTLASPAEGLTEYRNKVVLTIGRDVNGLRVAGFRVASGVVAAPCTGCTATCPAEIIDFCNEFSSDLLQQHPDLLSECHQLTLRSSKRTGQLVVTLVTNEFSDADLPPLRSWFQERCASQSSAVPSSPIKLLPWSQQTSFGSPTKQPAAPKHLQLQAAAICLPGVEPVMLCGAVEQLVWQESMRSAVRPDTELLFRVSPSAFFQVNTAAAEAMLSLIAECAFATSFDTGAPSSESVAPPANQVVLDLCCGTGTIGLALAGAGRRCVGVDICAAAIRDALVNRDANGLTDEADFVCGKVGEKITELIDRACSLSGSTDIVAICDPPRNGMRPAVSEALRQCAQVSRIVYVSCNPDNKFTRYDYVVGGGSLFENAKLLCAPADDDKGGPFQLSFAQPVDMFPSTPHVELVCVFDRVVNWV